MKFLDIFKKSDKTAPKSRGFSDFFLHASKKEKTEVFTEAAHKANEEQRDLFAKANLKFKAN